MATKLYDRLRCLSLRQCLKEVPEAEISRLPGTSAFEEIACHRLMVENETELGYADQGLSPALVIPLAGVDALVQYRIDGPSEQFRIHHLIRSIDSTGRADLHAGEGIIRKSPELQIIVRQGEFRRAFSQA